MTLPNFVIIGAMKAGTTSLFTYLKAHPQIFMSNRKEPNFFGDDRNWEKGLHWYKRHFTGAESAIATGEASPQYTMGHWFPHAPARMASLIPEARLIYLIRHPIERMQSQYLHFRAEGRESRPIERALREEEGYLNLSRYAYQLERYLEHFPLEHLLILTTTDLEQDPYRTLGRTFQFLAVDAQWLPPEFERRHVTAEKRQRHPLVWKLKRLPGYRAAARMAPMSARRLHYRLTTTPIDVREARISEGLRQEMEDRLRPDITRLRRYLGEDFHCWGIT